MSELAAALTRSMHSATTDLVVLDRENSSWQRYPWPEVHGLAEGVAAWLLHRGRPRAVGLVGEPTAEFVAAIQGGWLAGAALSILPGPVRGADDRQWAESTVGRFSGIGVDTVLSHGSYLECLRAVEAPGVTVDGVATAARTNPSSATALTTDGTTPAVLQGTAGSTGAPKTAILSPDAVLANLSALNHRWTVNSADIGCMWLPLYHDMGLSCLVASILAQMELWLAPTAAFSASPFRWLNWLSDSGATITAAPNFAYSTIGKYARRVSDVNLGALRVAINGGEPIDCDGFERFATAMAPFGFHAGAAAPSYGLAESTCAVTTPAAGTGLLFDHITDENGSHKHAILGDAVRGMQVRISPADREVGTASREIGDIEIRGTSMMDGYLGGQALGRDEWFPTGDLGYFADGGLVVCGRAKEVISIAGRNIFPTEIELVVSQVRGVREGAVVALGTGAGSLRPGLVVAAEFRGPNEDQARTEVIQRVASACGVVPSDVVFVAPGSLPRTSSGKLRRLEVLRSLEKVPQ